MENSQGTIKPITRLACVFIGAFMFFGVIISLFIHDRIYSDFIEFGNLMRLQVILMFSGGLLVGATFLFIGVKGKIPKFLGSNFNDPI